MKREIKKTQNRKFIIILMILVLLFSIFKIGNTFASTEAFSLTKVIISEKSDTVDVNSISFEKNIISNNITFHRVGDSVTYKLTIENNEDENYTIKSISDDNKNEYITYEYDSYEGTLLNSKEEKTFEIIAKYSNELMDLSKRNQDFSVTFTFVLEDTKGDIVETGATIESSNESSTSTEAVSNDDSNVIVAKSTNPRTGDSINFYIITSIASILMIIMLSKNKTTVKSNKRNNSKSSKKGKHSSNQFKFFSMFLALAIIIPTMAKASGNSFEVIFDNKIKLMDKLIVTYIIDDETDEIIVKYKDLVEKINAPDKEGYTFDGWYLEDGSTFDFSTPIIEDITITAKYNADIYNITYELNGGEVSENPSTYTVEDEITLNNPEKVGYTFSGWTGSNGDDLQTRVTINKGSTGDKNYIANYSANEDTKYTVIHSIMNLDGETYTEKERETLHGASDTTVKPQTNVYVGFTAPDEEEITIKADGSSVLEYKYTRNKYSFTVENTNDIDSENSTENGKYYYETVVKAIAKDKDGYTFNKWSNDETNKKTEFKLVEDTVINPIYDTIEYTITYYLDDGTVSGNPSTYTVESDDITLNKPTKIGYTFTGWTGTDINEETEDVKIEKGSIGNREYTAKYTVARYTLTATDVDSNSTPNGTYDYGTHVTLTAIDKEGYTFQKWSNEETTQTIDFDLVEDTTINPIYEGNTYYIRFNGNGLNIRGKMENQEIKYGDTTTLNINKYTDDGYIFQGWNTKANGSGTSYENGASISNLTANNGEIINLYGRWKLCGIRYAVQIYGIYQDEDEFGNKLGLTFGPATGAEYRNSYVTHEYEETSEGSGVYYVVIVTHNVSIDGSETISSKEYLLNSEGNKVTRTAEEKEFYDLNFHEMTWKQISEITDKNRFKDCMLCGDTKCVKLKGNSVLLSDGNSYSQYGDGAGILYNKMNMYFRRWNPSSSQNTAATKGGQSGNNANLYGGYAVSNIRATLIGKNSDTNVEFAGDKNMDSTTCMFSCIESEELKELITAKKVKCAVTTGKNTYISRVLIDKLWLFSVREISGNDNGGYYGSNNIEGIGSNNDCYDKFRDSESRYYIASYTNGATSSRDTYSEVAGRIGLGLRSISLQSNRYPYVPYCKAGGSISSQYTYVAAGIGFGFCIK